MAYPVFDFLIERTQSLIIKLVAKVARTDRQNLLPTLPIKFANKVWRLKQPLTQWPIIQQPKFSGSPSAEAF
ncbi:hypothetical protein H6G52_17950 [Limnothrix sp. FACHB-881]|uniref:hypothetical protein n=1 Tax=Limnothrix sp. FACHB-881 TaxID=2692819 RepID=UPI0016888630|nr:hypothetical protein [Limnothrix sp. FACHB-881]MBD2637258.1 hypothetical protein [Limnothrix sp. FACHB-881]